MPGTAARVRVSEKQLAVLQELSRSRTVAKGIVQRALILVHALQGLRNEQIAPEVGLNRQRVGVWRQRWRDAWDSLCVWECTEPHRLREVIQGGIEVRGHPERAVFRRARLTWPGRTGRTNDNGDGLASAGQHEFIAGNHAGHDLAQAGLGGGQRQFS